MALSSEADELSELLSTTSGWGVAVGIGVAVGGGIGADKARVGVTTTLTGGGGTRSSPQASAGRAKTAIIAANSRGSVSGRVDIVGAILSVFT